MAPKKKGGRKQEEDWEAELGESIPPAGGDSPAEDAPADDGADAGEGAAASGGLLAALRKNKNKKAKKGKPMNDFVEGEDPDADANGDADFASKQPEEGTFDEDDVFAGKKTKPIKEVPTPVEPETEDSGRRVKTKKEKEREKKEREKQRKKEQAAKKKPAEPKQAQQPKNEPKKEEPAAAPAAAAPEPATGGKKKKVPAHLAAIQKQQEALRQEREAEERRLAEEKAARDAQAALDEEEAKKKEEARQRKKEKEKEKKEQLRKEGKLLTKAQKEAKERNERRMQQMLAAGVGTVAGLEEGGEKKRPVYENRNRKKGPKKQEEDLEAAAARAKAQREAEDERRRKEEEEKKAKEEAEAAAAAKAAGEESELDDWEKAAEADDVKDSWDASSDEEEEKPGATNGEQKTLPERPAAKSAQKDDEDEESSDEDSDDDSDSEEEQSAAQKAIAQRKAEAAERRKKQHEEALAARSKDNLRSPICCILGHVDTGKTKLLDKIRQTNVQEGEAGGITQQIGATYFPVDALRQKTAVVNKDGAFEFKIPGLLVIDTPGHESFSNLRSRGSSLCNIAILVVDIMHGLEPQTLESMRLLRDRRTPFIVALNKIDRLYGWKMIANNGFQESLALQSKGVQNEFRTRLERTKLLFAEQGFNSELFYENKSMARNVSLVPTSAHTGEGVPDMLKLLTSLTQERMTNSLMYLSEVECTVLEVKIIEGLGTTIDVVLSNGILREGDRVVLCGLNGPIATNIRALLTPAPLKELRLKSQYVHNKEVKAALGVKIAANDLEHAIAGSRLMVVGPDDDEEDIEEEVMSDLENLLSKVSKDQRGVSVQASTLGSLEALLEFLRVSKIPVANISIGPVYKRDVMMCGTMLEKAKEYAVMLCFDVKVDKEAQAYADDVGVKVFTADIIYHLFDDFTKHMAELTERKKEEAKLLAVFPCVLKTVAVFNKKDPIVIGIDVIEGSLRLHTPISAIKTNATTGAKEIVKLGRVVGIERDHKPVNVVKRGQPSVAVKIEGANQPMYGRQLEESDTLYSEISRASIDTLKEFYRSDVSMEEWALIKKLKPVFDIP
ncbi:putative mitochondrial translation initiation factor IF-2 [Aspergillus stella-maris]|uniref:putative mitochondrial translation initiation factor IF-2 n=1 Tax=Aspergillus stella-maris TaxID=1810926 RepID=UPI003CCD299C